MQRSRLMLAIVEVTGESGLEAATVGRVCEQAGVSRRTFYELYEDREACLLAAFDRQVKRLEESVRSEFEGEGSWRARTRRALAALLECLDAEPHVARVCVIEALRAGPRLVEHRGRVLNALAAAIDEGRAEVRAGAEPPPLTARGVVGGVLSVIHARLLEPPSNGSTRPLVALTSPLMAMIVHPYLGAPAARKELERREPVRPPRPPRSSADPFKGLPIRFTYRTALVLATIASDPGASNRYIASSSGIADDGQMSRLLRRLEDCGLIENRGVGRAKGGSNAWTLSERGEAVHVAIAAQP